MNIRDYCMDWAEARRRRERERRIWELIGGIAVLALLAAAIILVLAAALAQGWELLAPDPTKAARQTPTPAVPIPQAGAEAGRLGPPPIARPAAPFLSGPRLDLTRLLRAIRLVESGGRANPPDGDGGRAIGPYQIHLAYWRDARPAGRYEDCRQESYARRVVLSYWRRHAPAVAARAAMAGKPEALASGDLEVLARIHNGGPRGAQSPATLDYWRRVRADLGT